MIKRFIIFLLLLQQVIYADFDYRVNNTNITLSENSYMYNYNRLRFIGDYKEGSFFGTVIADGVNYLGDSYINSNSFTYLKQSHSDTPFDTQTNFKEYGDGSIYSKIYRLYGGFEDEKNRIVVGVQNIFMGVGRIWTPTNLFNPKNSYAIESDEVFGVAAISYRRNIDDTSHITLVASQTEDNSFKYALRVKKLTNIGDIALNFVASDDVSMIGYEVEGDLFNTGIELRSEGAYIKNSIETKSGSQDIDYFQAIVGADYGFVNGLNIIVEALYSSDKFLYKEVVLNFSPNVLSSITYSHKYLGVSLNYSFNIFLDTSILYIESFNENSSRFISPSITYTLNDYNSFIFGAQIQNGDVDGEFGITKNRYYFKWSLSF